MANENVSVMASFFSSDRSKPNKSYTSRFFLFFAASVCMGLGCCLCGMVMPMVMSVTVLPVALTLAIGLQEVARNLGGVLSSVMLNAVGAVIGDNAVSQFTASAVLGIVVCVIAGVVAFKYNKQFKNVNMEKK